MEVAQLGDGREIVCQHVGAAGRYAFAVEPEQVAINVARGVKTGVAGLSIEDSTGDAANVLFEHKLAVERIRAARKAIDADNSGALLTGRCEAFLWGKKDLNLVIERLQAYSEAGADVLYAPGISTREESPGQQ